jgi:hypothetical protein
MATQIGELGVTFPDATLQTTAAIAGAPGFGGFTNMVVFTTSSFWMVPAGITKCKVTVVGGGGGSYQSYDVSGYNPSTGAGGTAIKIITGLSPGLSITVTVGTGGRMDISPGGTSSFGAYCSATGGAVSGNGGGIGVGGTININGGYGLSPFNVSSGESGTFAQASPFIAGASIFGNNSYGAGAPVVGQPGGTPGYPGVVIVEY